MPGNDSEIWRLQDRLEQIYERFRTLSIAVPDRQRQLAQARRDVMRLEAELRAWVPELEHLKEEGRRTQEAIVKLRSSTSANPYAEAAAQGFAPRARGTYR